MKDQEDKPNPLDSSLQRLSYAVPIVTDRLSKFSVGKNRKFRHRTYCVPVKYKRLYLQEKYGGEGYSAESMHSYYSDLSRFTHPRYRADSFEPAHGPPSPDSLDPISGVRMRAAELAIFTAHFMWISLNVYAMRKPLYKIKQLTPAKFSLT